MYILYLAFLRRINISSLRLNKDFYFKKTICLQFELRYGEMIPRIHHEFGRCRRSQGQDWDLKSLNSFFLANYFSKFLKIHPFYIRVFHGSKKYFRIFLTPKIIRFWKLRTISNQMRIDGMSYREAEGGMLFFSTRYIISDHAVNRGSKFFLRVKITFGLP